MSSVDKYLNYAETALSAYSNGLNNTAEEQRIAAYEEAGLSKAEAKRFSSNWLVLSQSPDAANGFSAVLLTRQIHRAFVV